MNEADRQALGLTSVRIDVAGRPRTKGSLVPVHQRASAGTCRVSLKESGEYSVAWKHEMVRAIRGACRVERFPGEVVVDTFFRFEKLCLPDQDMAWPTRVSGEFAHGDEDKLRRNVLDALTQSGLILDDSNVVGGQCWKRWAMADESAGVLIRVHPAMTSDVSVRLMEREW
jgi:hypothetical protein